MAHGHEHTADRSSYYLEQLCSIGSCGAMGVISILMYVQGRLEIILVPSFFVPVLCGGIALVALVFVRATALWREVGRSAAHEHVHDEHCDHDHGNHAEAHHVHEHSWTPAKFAVLLLPIILYVLGVPNEGFSNEWLSRSVLAAPLEVGDKNVTAKGNRVLELGFRELAEAAYVPSAREHFEGQTGRLKGMFMRLGGDKEFTLFKIKMRCCAADAVPVQVRIISPVPLAAFQTREWVEVQGQIQFRKLAGQEKYVPVLMLASPNDVKKTEPGANEFDEA